MAKIRIPSKLIVLMNGKVIGEVKRANGLLEFNYGDEWISSRQNFSLSMSMPVARTRHDHKKITNFMWGLLPDSANILEGIGMQHGVPTATPYPLLWKIGEDCPGAVQFVEESRVADIANNGTIFPIDDVEISKRLKDLRSGVSIGRSSTSEGQFSLSGAQPKTALSYLNGEWGIPSGRMPTTHILKPPTSHYPGLVENEHFCLTLARKLGILSARSWVAHFGDEMTIVVQRYDRHIDGNRVIRIHQEDMCQALGIHPEFKYESQGGPNIISIMKQLYHVTSPLEDTKRFMSAIIFNFLICGTDAHAKNYSLLHAPKTVKLAPLYDLISYLPYVDYFPSLRMSMRIDKHYEYELVQKRHWENMAATLKYPCDALFSAIESMSRDMPQAALETAEELRDDGVPNDVIARLVEAIANRCRNVRRTLGFATPEVPSSKPMVQPSDTVNRKAAPPAPTPKPSPDEPGGSKFGM